MSATDGVHDRRFLRLLRRRFDRVESFVGSSPRELSAIRAAVRRLRPDCVVAGPLSPVAAALSGASPSGARVVISWGYDLLRDAPRSTVARRAATVAISSAHLLVVDTQAGAAAARMLPGAGDVPCVIAPWGLERLKQILATGTARRTVRERKNVLLSARPLSTESGIWTVLSAAKLLNDHGVRFELVLVGEGKEADRVRAWIEANGLGRRIRLTGAVPEARLIDLLAQAKVYVSGSPVDGSSITLLQAMAAGAIPIVPDIAGNREWVMPGAGGFVYPSGDAAELAERCERALVLPSSRRAAMTAANRAIVSDEADWAANGKRILDAIVEATRSRDGRRPGKGR